MMLGAIVEITSLVIYCEIYRFAIWLRRCIRRH